MGPAASLEARDIGMDFAGADGWRMYHGSVVPGFPQHPHRGFETVTFVRQGFIDHSDSLGATARFGRGDVQWLTAGAGIVHCEMFPLLDRRRPEPVRAVPDLAEPAGRRQDGRPLLHDAVGPGHPPPRRHRRRRPHHRGHRHRRRARPACSRRRHRPARGRRGPRPTSPSGTSRSSPAREWTLPPAAGPDTVRTLYVFEGSVRDRRPRPGGVRSAPCVRADEPVAIAGGPYGAEALVLQGRPIGEPVAQYGPFVMNDQAGIEQAFADYRATGLRRLAVADRRSGPPPRGRPLRPPRRRPRRGAGSGQGSAGRRRHRPSLTAGAPPRRAVRQDSRPAMRLMPAATITTPNTYDKMACPSTVRLMRRSRRLVSETWYVIPIVNAR